MSSWKIWTFGRTSLILIPEAKNICPRPPTGRSAEKLRQHLTCTRVTLFCSAAPGSGLPSGHTVVARCLDKQKNVWLWPVGSSFHWELDEAYHDFERKRVWAPKWHQTPPRRKCGARSPAWCCSYFRADSWTPVRERWKDKCRVWKCWRDCYWQAAVILHFYNRCE